MGLVLTEWVAVDLVYVYDQRVGRGSHRVSAGATRVGALYRGWWRRGVRDMPAGRGHIETVAVGSRRLVRRQYLESRPHVRNRGYTTTLGRQYMVNPPLNR